MVICGYSVGYSSLWHSRFVPSKQRWITVRRFAFHAFL